MLETRNEPCENCIYWNIKNGLYFNVRHKIRDISRESAICFEDEPESYYYDDYTDDMSDIDDGYESCMSNLSDDEDDDDNYLYNDDEFYSYDLYDFSVFL
jgi:hypothetical protein